LIFTPILPGGGADAGFVEGGFITHHEVVLRAEKRAWAVMVVMLLART